MAILTIKVDDETLQKYAGKGKKTATHAIEAIIERFKDYSPEDRLLFLTDSDRRELEALAQKTFETSEGLLRWLKGLVNFSVAGVEVPMRDGQRKRLKAEADFYKQPFPEYVARRVTQVIEQSLGAM